MILLLGGTGYIGSAFAAELKKRGRDFRQLSRAEVDYSNFEALLRFLEKTRPEFIVNAAGYTGKPNVDACEVKRAETLQGNALLPATIAHAATALDIPWGHVSSGCIYTGAKVEIDGAWRIEPDLMKEPFKSIATQSPERLRGFAETDTPNFSFRSPPCSFYSGTKALGEEAILNVGRNYIWRLRIPFDHENNPRNYLAKIQNYAKVYDNFNSISHRGDFASACLDLWEKKAAFGIYNVTNPGYVSTRQVVGLIERILKPARQFEFWENDAEFYRVAANTPRSNCLMETAKVEAAGVRVRPVLEAIESSLRNWH
jgi:dTDP-4-dehydrorhamnose reductase